MGSADLADLSVYPITPLEPTTALLLTPASRWRVIVEHLEEEPEDAIRQAVVGLRAAGVDSASRISDLLQLPEVLVQHLLAEAAAHHTIVERSGALTSVRSRTAWVYRDGLTGELWPEPGDEIPPLDVTFTSSRRGRLKRGSAGSPESVDCFLVDPGGIPVHDPSPVELAAFSRASREARRRTALVSQGSRCLVASRVVSTSAGWQVESCAGQPHFGVSRRINQLTSTDGGLQRWLSHQGLAHATADDPLDRAADDLRTVQALLPHVVDGHDYDKVLSRVALCLTRFVDDYCYRFEPKVEPTRGVSTHEAAALVRALALPARSADRIARSLEGSVERVVSDLLSSEMTRHPADRDGVNLLASSFQAWSCAVDGQLGDHLRLLVDRTLTLCNHAAARRKDDDGAQT